MESPKSEGSDDPNRMRRLSAPAKLQTFDPEEPTALKTRESAANIHLYYSDNRSLITRRSRATIHHHYFPEGGWGVVVVICVSIAHSITAGSQLSLGSAIKYFHFGPGEELSVVKSGNVLTNCRFGPFDCFGLSDEYNKHWNPCAHIEWWIASVWLTHSKQYIISDLNFYFWNKKHTLIVVWLSFHFDFPLLVNEFLVSNTNPKSVLRFGSLLRFRLFIL